MRPETNGPWRKGTRDLRRRQPPHVHRQAQPVAVTRTHYRFPPTIYQQEVQRMAEEERMRMYEQEERDRRFVERMAAQLRLGVPFESVLRIISARSRLEMQA